MALVNNSLEERIALTPDPSSGSVTGGPAGITGGHGRSERLRKHLLIGRWPSDSLTASGSQLGPGPHGELAKT